jgi:hypothetical protein
MYSSFLISAARVHLQGFSALVNYSVKLNWPAAASERKKGWQVRQPSAPVFGWSCVIT